jgi:hypothetical protein
MVEELHTCWQANTYPLIDEALAPSIIVPFYCIAVNIAVNTHCCQQPLLSCISLRLQVRLGDALHAGRLAYMDSPLGAPGGLGGSLLVQHCFEV